MLENISFGAWQISCFSGCYKKGFAQYKKDIGLKADTKKRKVDKSEKEVLQKKVVSIHERVMRAQNVQKKNI
jgi:hypothetical protein